MVSETPLSPGLLSQNVLVTTWFYFIDVTLHNLVIYFWGNLFHVSKLE